MLRGIFKVLLIAAVLVLVGNYLMYLLTGRAPLSNLKPFSAFTRTSAEVDLSDFETVNSPQSPAYKWRENGRWHYGDTPPKGADAQPLH